MALALASVSDYLYTTSGLLTASTSKTVMCWTKQSVLPSGSPYNTSFESTNLTPATATQWAGIFEIFDTGVAYDSLDANDGVTHSLVNVASLAAGLWVHQCLTYNAATHNFVYYRNGAVASSGNFNINGNTWTYQVCGGDGFTHVGTFTVSQYREWSRVLTTFEIQTEMQSATAASATNLWRDTPLASTITDVSGNGRNWTQAGSGTFVADPTYPSNNAITAAQVVGDPPQALTFSFGDGAFAWFKLPATVSPVTGWWAHTSDLSDDVQSRTFNLDFSAYPPLGGPMFSDNLPMQIPRFAATDVYVRVQAGAPISNDVSITLAPTPNAEAPFGALMINDDTPDYPLAILSPTTGLVLQFVQPFPAGESVGVFNDGHILLDDAFFGTMQLYDPDLTGTGAVPYPGGVGALNSINSDRTSRYYVMPETGTNVYVYNGAGTLVSTEAIGVTALLAVPNRGNTILYYVVPGSNKPIKRWDLVAHAPLSDLVAGAGTGYFIGNNMLVLADDTLIVSYGKTGDAFVRHYSTAGAILHTYTLADPTERINWIQLGLEDDSSRFLIWSNPVGQFIDARFTYINVTDGSVISQTPVVPAYEAGIMAGNDADEQTLTPTSLFGHSGSCPIWILAATRPAGPGPTTGTITVIKVTVPPELLDFDYQTTGGLTPDTFSLANGETQTYTGLAPGTYGVTEDVATNWTTTYMVDNGDEHDAITLDAGDHVTVTVTNTFVSAGGSVREYLVRRERWFPVISQEQQRLFFQKLQVDLQAGNGLTTGQGSAPLMEIDWSDDGGFTWSNIRFTQSGPLGQYQRRVIERMLGQSRSRVFRLAVSDPVQWIVVDGYMDLIAGSN